MNTNPSEAYAHATDATKLGDLEAPSLQAHLLDYGGAPSDGPVGKDRLLAVSQLIVKLDSVFAFHATGSETIRNTGFVKFLTGEQITNVLHFTNLVLLDQWSSHTISQLKTLTLSDPIIVCIICLSDTTIPHSCKRCSFKVYQSNIVHFHK